MYKLKTIIVVFLIFCPGFGSFIHAQNSETSPQYYQDSVEFFLEAAEKGNYYGVLESLKKGIDVNTGTWDGVTALMYASAGGYKSIVNLLVKYGANVNKRPDNGITPLIAASQYGYTEIAKILINDSAALNMSDNYHATALHYASLYNNDTIVFMLLNAGADENSLTYDSLSPLSMAAMNGSYEAAFQLIEAGANVNSTDNYGFTPLMLACQNGSIAITRLLINNDANIGLKNKKGYSALSLAASNGNANIVAMLLHQGANPKESGTLSLNPRALAKLSKDKATLDTLKRARAGINFLPAFKTFGVGLELNGNSKDLFTGIYITQNDLKYGLVYNFGFEMRPFVLTMLESVPDYGYFQFREHRYLFTLDIAKRISIIHSQETDWGIGLGVRGSYSFGKYRATDIPIHGGLNGAPTAWTYYRNNHWETRLGYQYSNYGEPNLSYSHITLGLVYHFSFPVKPDINRKIKWLNQ